MVLIFVLVKLNKMKKEDLFKTKYSEQDREKIIKYFYTKHDNRDKIISQNTSYSYACITWTIREHLREKIDRINKRKYEDIDWGKL